MCSIMAIRFCVFVLNFLPDSKQYRMIYVPNMIAVKNNGKYLYITHIIHL